MGKVSESAKSAAKKGAGALGRRTGDAAKKGAAAVGRGGGRLAKKSIASGYEAGRSRQSEPDRGDRLS